MSDKHAVLHPIGMLKQYTHGLSDVSIEPGKTIRDVFDQLCIPTHVVALVLVNKEVVSKDYLIRQNDYIEIMAVLGGG